MGKRYNIINKINNAQERSTVQIDDEHEFKINDSFPAAMTIKAFMEDETLDESKKIEKVIGVAFKKEDIKYLESLNLKMEGYVSIVNVVMAAISDKDLEEIEKKQEERETPSK